jgi:hypothetical protein
MEDRPLLKYLVGMIGFIIRVIPHIPNLTPFGALILSAGSKNSYKSLGVLFIALFLSDLVLGLHKTMMFVYIGFLISFFLGKILLKNSTFLKIVGTTFLSSLLFFLITNFGSWITTSVYQKNIHGLMNAYAMGIPFFRNTLIGDLFYSMVVFYGIPYIVKQGNKILISLKKEILTIS